VGDKNISYTIYFTGVNLLFHHISAKRFRGIYVDLIAIGDKHSMNLRYCSATDSMMSQELEGRDEGEVLGKDGERKWKEIFK